MGFAGARVSRVRQGGCAGRVSRRVKKMRIISNHAHKFSGNQKTPSPAGVVFAGAGAWVSRARARGFRGRKRAVFAGAGAWVSQPRFSQAQVDEILFRSPTPSRRKKTYSVRANPNPATTLTHICSPFGPISPSQALASFFCRVQ